MNMKYYRIIFACVLLLVLTTSLFTGCSDSTSQEEGTITDTKWVLESYGDAENLVEVIPDTEITAEFSSDENRVKGSAGCNSYSATYSLEGDQLSINSGIAVTEMYRLEPEGVMDQERHYLDLLIDVVGYEIENAKLILHCDGEVLIYKDQIQ